MENENPSHNSHNSHGDEFNRSIPTNIQWMPQFQFQESLFQPFNPSLFYQQQQRMIQQSQLSSGIHHALQENMVYGSQDSHGSSHQAEGRFHSQPSQDQRLSQASEQNSTIARGINWSILEDTRLCNAWVRVSIDPITGSDQKRQGFWARVHDEFAKQHGQNELVSRNQRACGLRMQHIKADLNKWSAALKKVQEYPRSGANELMEERTAHAFYSGQNKDKAFKLDHCWEILSTCAKFAATLHSKAATNLQINCTSSRARTSSTPIVEETSPSTDELDETHSQARTEFSLGSHNECNLDEEAVNNKAHATIARNLGRKATKRARKQAASIVAHSAIGEKVVKSLEELQAKSSQGWQKTNELNEEEQQISIKYKKLEMLIGRIAFENKLIIAEKNLYEFEQTVVGPPDKARVVAERKRRLADLQAQVDAFVEFDTSSTPSSSIGNARNLLSRFDEEAIE